MNHVLNSFIYLFFLNKKNRCYPPILSEKYIFEYGLKSISRDNLKPWKKDIKTLFSKMVNLRENPVTLRLFSHKRFKFE